VSRSRASSSGRASSKGRTPAKKAGTPSLRSATPSKKLDVSPFSSKQNKERLNEKERVLANNLEAVEKVLEKSSMIASVISRATSKKLEDAPQRNSARIAAKLSAIDSDIDKKDKFADVPTIDVKRRSGGAALFGGAWAMPIWTFIVPAYVVSIVILSGKSDPKLEKLLDLPKRVEYYLDWKAAAVFLGWLTFQALVYMIPIGRKVDGMHIVHGSKLKYRLNGVWALFLTLGALAGMWYMQVPVVDYVMKHTVHLVVAAILTSFLLSLVLYISARKKPKSALTVYGNTGNFLIDYFMGRELNPRIKSFDVKMFLSTRPGYLGWLVLNVVYIWKSLSDGKDQLNYPLLVSASLQLLYILDALWFEETFLTTYDITTEGVGAMLVGRHLAFIPAIVSVSSRYLLLKKLQLPWYCLAGTAVLGLIGYIIYRAANSQLNAFKKNPYNPLFENMQKIPTATSKKLLAGSWWGKLRRPNYLGDMLQAVAWCIPCGVAHVLPYAYPIYLIPVLMHRAIRVESHCRGRYGAAWDRYRQQAKYRIIPYIY